MDIKRMVESLVRKYRSRDPFEIVRGWKTNTIFMDTRTGFNTDRLENEANTFAMNLLIGDDILEEYRGYTVEQISRILGYEKRLIDLRLGNYETARGKLFRENL